MQRFKKNKKKAPDPKELLRIAELIRKAVSEGPICVVAPREMLAEIKDLERILEI